MSRWTTLLWTVLLVAATAAGVTWLRATAPESRTDTAVELPVEDHPLTCDDLTGGQDGSTIPRSGSGPVGRALSGEVLSCPDVFDGLLVTYIGEVVGDVLARDGGSWLLVNDDPYALELGPLGPGDSPAGTNSGLAVWVPDPLDELADEPGRSDVRGDVLEVTGRVKRADPADGGGLTIRAEEARIVAEAVAVETPVHWRQVVVAIVLSLLALLTLWRERSQRDP